MIEKRPERGDIVEVSLRDNCKLLGIVVDVTQDYFESEKNELGVIFLETNSDAATRQGKIYLIGEDDCKTLFHYPEMLERHQW